MRAGAAGPAHLGAEGVSRGWGGIWGGVGSRAGVELKFEGMGAGPNIPPSARRTLARTRRGHPSPDTCSRSPLSPALLKPWLLAQLLSSTSRCFSLRARARARVQRAKSARRARRCTSLDPNRMAPWGRGAGVGWGARRAARGCVQAHRDSQQARVGNFFPPACVVEHCMPECP